MGKQATTGRALQSEVTVREVSQPGRVDKETVYTDDTRTVKVREVAHTYQGNKLTQTVTTHYAGGVAGRVETLDYFEDQVGGVTHEIEKRS
ncbi:MAG TPA: hypothetical protein VM389_03775 [Phycisphaerae bacterium]|nr:hypothetical protein [Phycisphaerae bacterium]HUU60101.1 hypothetical protein [Phycisphaerae bacterium]